MSIENAILGLLSIRPLTGYEIKKIFVGSSLIHWSDNNNLIYKALLRLLEDECVTRSIEEQEDHPARKIYTISPKGMCQLKEWVIGEVEIPQIKHPFLLQLAWADLLTNHELDELLERYEIEIKMRLILIENEGRKNATLEGAVIRNQDSYLNLSAARTKREAYLWEMIMQNRIAVFRQELSWVQKLRAEIGS